MTALTAIALSGGLDSAVAALRLKAAGEKLLALHFITGYEPDDRMAAPRCRLERLAARLEIPLAVIDCRKAFQREVVDHFVNSYRLGRTPNPCVRCNARIKFGGVLQQALDLGAGRLATGHYAQRRRDDAGRFHLHKGIDRHKDQSYFLARLSHAQLEKAVFPLGALTKAQVQRQAAEAALMLRPPRESQDICFVCRGNYAAFLTGPGRLVAAPGPIVDVAGRQLGRHRGLHAFTIGQRRGIDCPGPAPYYVVRIDAARNTLVVGSAADLMAAGCRVSEVRWLQPPAAETLRVSVRLRYRSVEQPARVTIEAGANATVHFDTPLAAVTPGQCAVFYRGDEVLGAGWIEAPLAC
jgi:tRNA-uridine 2-sulfurtransferase